MLPVALASAMYARHWPGSGGGDFQILRLGEHPANTIAELDGLSGIAR